jgi:SAM-dependent methyltransferase
MNSLSCKSCGSLDIFSRKYVDDFFSKTQLFNDHVVVCCKQCGFGYSSPKLEDRDIYEFYKNVYRNAESPYYINFDQLSPQGKDRAIAQLQLGLNFLKVTDFENLIFLDIGPGDGSSFVAALEKNIKNFYAIELSKDSANAYEKLFKVSTFEVIEEIPENILFDIVLSSHCFEHFYYEDLIVYLKKLKVVMNPNGVVIVEVPNDDFRVMKKYSDSPHFIFFSKESIRNLFIKCGYDILFCETCGHKIDDYDDITKKEHGFISRLKSSVTKVISSVAFGRTIIDFIKRVLIKFQIIPDPKNSLVDFNKKTYEYGGDRICLRIVAKPITSKQS